MLVEVRLYWPSGSADKLEIAQEIVFRRKRPFVALIGGYILESAGLKIVMLSTSI
jgi:hypothetical protein